MAARKLPDRTTELAPPPAAGGPRRWLLAALAALSIARPLVPGDAVVGRGDGIVFVMLWLLVVLAWLLAGLTRPRFSLRYEAPDLLLLVLLAWHSLSAVVAAWHGSPRPAINTLWEWLALGIGFFVIRQVVVTAAEARALMVGMIGVAVALSAIGYYQYFYSIERDRARYEQIKDDPAEMMRVAGQWYPPDSPQRTQFENRLNAHEPSATFALTNSLAGYLAPWLVITLGLGVTGRHPGAGPAAAWLRAAVLALPIAGVLLLTKSRSGVLAAGVGAVLLWLMCRRPQQPRRCAPWVALAGVMLALTLGVVAIGGLDRQVLTEAGKSLGYRCQYWRSTLAMIADHPWLGCGPGQFQDFYTGYKLPSASEEIRDPHNFLLEVWASAGTPALLALIGVMTLFAHRLWRSFAAGAGGERGTAEPAGGAARFVTGGAVAGLLLAWLVAPLLGFALEPATVLLSALALAAGLLLGQAWIAESRPLAGGPVTLLAAVGTSVLLVNLLAAGGIGYPGVAGTLWLLVALGLGGFDPVADRAELPKALLWLGLGVTTALLVACYITAYRPVLESRSWIARASSAAGLSHRGTLQHWLEQAVDADPLSADAAEMLAALRFAQWRDAPVPEHLRSFGQAARRAVQLAPRSSSTWSQTGQWWLAIYRHTRTKQSLSLAVEAHGRAVECYPNSALLRARYAVALSLTGADEEAARQQAGRSLDLDMIAHRAGHTDKCLGAELRRHVSRIHQGKVELTLPVPTR